MRINLSKRKFSSEEVDESIENTLIGGKVFERGFLSMKVDEKVEQLSPSNLPRRFLEEPLPEGGSKWITMNKEEFVNMVKVYYELRGWGSKGGPKVT